MRNLALLMAVPLAACTSIQPAPAPDICQTSVLAQFAGQQATGELGAAMLRASGKTALRWVQPGMAVTMDYREDRLTVYLGPANKVDRASCG